MDKKKANTLLKQALIEIPHLRRLHPENQEVVSWYDKVCTIIKEVSSINSEEYKQFTNMTALFKPTSDTERQEAYNSYLDYKESALNSIIDKYEPWQKKHYHEIKDFIVTAAKLFPEMFKAFTKN